MACGQAETIQGKLPHNLILTLGVPALLDAADTRGTTADNSMVEAWPAERGGCRRSVSRAPGTHTRT